VNRAQPAKHTDSFYLLEFASSARARCADAWARADALETAVGLAGAAVVLPHAPEPGDGLGETHRTLKTLGPDDWPRELDRLALGAAVPTLVLAGDDSPALLHQVRSRWPGALSVWPTRLGPQATSNQRALRCAVAARPRAPRTRTPLWDGNYLLAPAALAGEAGRVWIDSFATLAVEQDMLDLVILAEPEPDLQRLARARGVSLRVHWIGASPLRAECLWMACASALLVGGELPDASALLRSLETAVPLLVAGADPATTSMSEWLTEHGAASTLGRPAVAPALVALRAAIARTPEMRLVASRAAALSDRHLPERIAPVLRASLLDGSADARRAA